MDWLLNGILDWLTKMVLGTFDALIGLITGSLLVSPDVTTLPQVIGLSTRSVWVVDSIFVLAFVAAGALTMFSGGSERSRYHIKDLAPRLVVGFIGAHFSQVLISKGIEVANAITEALASQPMNSAAAKAMRSHIVAASKDPTTALLAIVIACIIVMLLAATTFQMIMRFAALLVMAIIAPLAMACHALPATEGLARLWWRQFAGCLATPVLQALCLTTGQWMLTDPSNMLAAYALPGGDVLQLFVVMVVLWMTVKVPGLVAKFAGQPAGGGKSNPIVALVKFATVQQVTKLVPGSSKILKAVRP
ncbi:conjugal transfer protein TrbL family protein [Longispora albida]|uniref:conjugal transfer protein TrbL family protein n=1 Tax=Longispora albida TaxID=203523 RepID=UPI00037080D3|nr:conjugal transfer protein TrbL family protein [Longispora albida]